MNIPTAVFGASGYTGGELLRYLAGHGGFDVVWATAERNAGRPVGEVFPNLPRFADLALRGSDEEPPEIGLAFLALPHGQAAELGRKLLARGARVVDLSADWRLGDPALYPAWYGWEHPAPGELGDWVYGLPEAHREEIADARAVAAPGCYPTAAILALAPVLRAAAVEPQGIVVSAASGVSGAGRKLDTTYLYGELEGSYKAYGIGSHRHTPEIEQELAKAAGVALQVTFTPHLAPMTRGILATCYARMTGRVDDVRSALVEAYADEPFVHVLDGQPATKQTSGTNLALIGVGADVRTSTAVVTCAIDNLGKGASGQAVQCANLMCGLPEDTGLGLQGVWP